MAKNEKTSERMAKLAAKILADGRSGEAAKRLAGSVLTQTPDRIKKSLSEKAKRGK